MEQRERFRSYSALTNLIHVDSDAARAYAQAIEAVGATAIRRRLEAFRDEHERHIDAIAAEIRALGMEPPPRYADRRGFLLTGYMPIFPSMGTEAALRALRANETLTNHRYDQALAADLPDPVRQLIERNRLDERRHIRFLEDVIERRSWEAGADAEADGR
ncbi:MAG TPA: ferritin-like domain-containing protein [Alphaproteobacteria bacterium]|nr:ferritin-like domain-containing protein [Alphaproteobacteria bacterium]